MSFIGCENNEISEFPNSTVEPKVEITDVLENPDLNRVAKMVSEMGLDLEMVKEMKVNVERSLKNGGDEEVTFKEILSQAPTANYTRGVSGTKGGKFASKFAERLKQKTPSSGTKSAAPSELLQNLEMDGVNLYWPYSEDWDGITMPVIAVSPEDDTQDKCIAYKLIDTEEGFILDETLIIDEEYAKINPVWVINYAEVMDAPNVVVTPRDYSVTNNSTEIGKEIATVYLGSFKSTKQHDPWHKGGSEYYVEATSPLHKEVNGK